MLAQLEKEPSVFAIHMRADILAETFRALSNLGRETVVRLEFRDPMQAMEFHAVGSRFTADGLVMPCRGPGGVNGWKPSR